MSSVKSDFYLYVIISGCQCVLLAMFNVKKMGPKPVSTQESAASKIKNKIISMSSHAFKHIALLLMFCILMLSFLSDYIRYIIFLQGLIEDQQQGLGSSPRFSETEVPASGDGDHVPS